MIQRQYLTMPSEQYSMKQYKIEQFFDFSKLEITLAMILLTK